MVGNEEGRFYRRNLFIGDCLVGCSGVLNTVEINSFPLDTVKSQTNKEVKLKDV